MELGLRYRPARADQLEGHQAKIAALIADLTDVPIAPLERACRRWVTEQRWMPAASDLIEMARAAVAPPPVAETPEAWASRENASMRRRDIEWFTDSDGSLKLRYKLTEEQHLWKRDRIMPDDVTSCNYGLRKWDSRIRFMPDGYPYELRDGDPDPAPNEYPSEDRRRVIERRDREALALTQ